MSGILWIVGTPIGNRDDISSRAIQVLSHVEYIVAEDTRVTRVLLSALGIYEKKLLSLYDHVEVEKSERILSMLLEGKEVALVSDAGMPCISDPGYVLVRTCHKHNIPVHVVPGASSITTLLAGSGIPSIPCTFLGFLPRGRGERIRTFEQYLPINTSLVFFERKNRVVESLSLAYEVLGEREVCIGRELTKQYEEYIHCMLSSDMSHLGTLQGEITIIIGKSEHGYRTPLEEVLTIYTSLSGEKSIRQEVKELQSKVYGYSAKELYTLIVENRDNKDEE